MMMPIVEGAVLAVVDSLDARQTMRNISVAYDDAVVERFGRAVLFEPTEIGAFLAFRLRAKHEGVRIQRTRPVDGKREPYRRAYDAAIAFENRQHKYTPYPKFAAGTDHPLPEEMRERRLIDDLDRRERTRAGTAPDVAGED